MNSNRLISGYQNYNNNFQNNRFLQNNSHANNAAQHYKTQQLKQTQNMKRLEKTVELSEDEIRNALIKPLDLKHEKKIDVEGKWKKIESGYKADKKNELLQKYWKDRNNIPYKKIMKQLDKKDYEKIKKKEDLIIHKVTASDKYGVEDDYIDLIDNLEEHDDELKMIYSTSEQAKYLKKFDIEHKQKYRVKFKTSDHGILKNNRMEYYTKEQKKLEKGKNKKDSILNQLMNSGFEETEDAEENMQAEENMDMTEENNTNNQNNRSNKNNRNNRNNRSNRLDNNKPQKQEVTTDCVTAGFISKPITKRNKTKLTKSVKTGGANMSDYIDEDSFKVLEEKNKEKDKYKNRQKKIKIKAI